MALDFLLPWGIIFGMVAASGILTYHAGKLADPNWQVSVQF
jgi:hypothetical protein